MPRKVSIKRVAKQAVREDAKDRVSWAEGKTVDSIQNFIAKLGIGTDNLQSATTYGFNPITRNRTLLEWMHRGTWLGGVAIDIIGDDMTKRGVDLKGDIQPEDIAHLERAAETYDIWTDIGDTVKWSRLYGGAMAVMMIDGQRPDTPLMIERVGKQMFKGLYVFDRWSVDPSLEDLVTEYGPETGMPRFYTVTANAAAMRGQKIHYSRILRLDGIDLPWQQRVMENLWGISVFERLYDRMVAFDSASQGAAQLMYRSYLRSYKIKGLREIIAAGGPAEAQLIRFVQMMTRFQASEGMTIIDMEDEFGEHGGANAGMRGMSDLLVKFGEQISGSLQIPLVRLFGQSPSGLNSSGESELRTYYDGINMRQNRELRNPVTRIYRVMAQSEGIKIPEGFSIEFRPLWIMNDAEKAAIFTQVASGVAQLDQAGIIRRDTSLKEVRQSSKVTGLGSNISDQEIADAEMEPPPGAQEAMALEQQSLGMEQTEQSMEHAERNQQLAEKEPKGKGKKTRDRAGSILGDREVMGFHVVVEHEKGDFRYGNRLPAAYGYIRQTHSAEGADQMDCFIGPDLSGKIFIVDSYVPVTGKFDEHKVMFGYGDKEAALADFRNYYNGFGPQRRIGKTQDPMTQEELTKWLATGDLSQPYYEPTNVEYVAVAEPGDERCRACKYYDTGICSNHATHHDPRVPETYDGLKMVAASGWCREFVKIAVTEVEREV